MNRKRLQDLPRHVRRGRMLAAVVINEEDHEGAVELSVNDTRVLLDPAEAEGQSRALLYAAAAARAEGFLYKFFAAAQVPNFPGAADAWGNLRDRLVNQFEHFMASEIQAETQRNLYLEELHLVHLWRAGKLSEDELSRLMGMSLVEFETFVKLVTDTGSQIADSWREGARKYPDGPKPS